jgi:hypothetical protein
MESSVINLRQQETNDMNDLKYQLMQLQLSINEKAPMTYVEYELK